MSVSYSEKVDAVVFNLQNRSEDSLISLLEFFVSRYNDLIEESKTNTKSITMAQFVMEWITIYQKYSPTVIHKKLEILTDQDNSILAFTLTN